MIRHHHERLDGRGYPDGLAGESIPLGARIIAVADTFDAITSSRSYRVGRPRPSGQPCRAPTRPTRNPPRRRTQAVAPQSPDPGLSRPHPVPTLEPGPDPPPTIPAPPVDVPLVKQLPVPVPPDVELPVDLPEMQILGLEIGSVELPGVNLR